MTIERLLLVEDNQRYLDAAIQALGKYDFLIANDYNSAIPQIERVGGVITDLFFPLQQGDNDRNQGYNALESIKRGIILPYFQETKRRLDEEGIEISPEINKAIEILGMHAAMRANLSKENKTEKYSSAVIAHLKYFREGGGARLLRMIEDGINGSFGSYKSVADSYSERLFNPIRQYMEESPSNQPLGYLVAEEAEKQGKPFVIATSLRHSNDSLHPILLSARQRGWPLLEGGDGSKESPDFWLKAYQQLKGGGENGINRR
jgi:hypothetical protein